MDHIEPAIPINGPSQSISPQEFQSLLISWYEEKGILSQLRTQLRYKMINVLKDTVIGQNIIKKSSQTSISLSKQAVNLIVAEFLMKNNCEYSLSIFNTESGLSTTYSDNVVIENGKQTLTFNSENITNILELIGINKYSNVSKDILDMYYDKECSILQCMINVLSKPWNELNAKSDFYIDFTHEPEFIREIGTTLLESNVSVEKVYDIIEGIKCFHDDEIQSMKVKYNKMIDKLTNTLSLKDKLIEKLEVNKKAAESKLYKIIRDNNSLKRHMKLIIKQNLIKEQKSKRNSQAKSDQIETIDINLDKNIKCTLDHCSNACGDNKRLLDKYQQENQQLQQKNLEQHNKINDLQLKYNELLQDYHLLQKQINLLNNKLTEENPISYMNINCIEEENKEASPRNDTDSDSISDEIIRQAWYRLEQLEKESKEIEERYKC